MFKASLRLSAKLSLLFSAIIFQTHLAGQDVELRPLEHEDYSKWNTIGSPQISGNGDWVSFEKRPGKGDSTLYVRSNRSAKVHVIPRGQNARFSFDSTKLFYVIAPEKKEKANSDSTKSTPNTPAAYRLEILHLRSGERESFDGPRSYRLPEKSSGWIAFKLDRPKAKPEPKASDSKTVESYLVTPEGLRRPPRKSAQKMNAPAKANKQSEKKPGKGKQNAVAKNQKKAKASPTKMKSPAKSKTQSKKTLGSVLVLRNTNSKQEYRFPWVVDFRFDKSGTQIAFSTSGPDADNDGISVFDLKTRLRKLIAKGPGQFGVPVFDSSGNHLAFLKDQSGPDSKQNEWSLQYCKKNQKTATTWMDSATEGLPKGWEVFGKVAPQFSEDGSRLFVQTRPKPESDESDDDKDGKSDAEKKAKLDLWHWQDQFLQPQQLLQVQQEKNRSYLGVIDLKTKQFCQLATLEIPNVSVDTKSTGEFVLGSAPNKYNKSRSWDVPGYTDYYLIRIRDGEAIKVAEKSQGSARLSPEGNYLTWWDGDKRKWYSLNVKTIDSKSSSREAVDIGKAIPYPLYNELHDSPSVPGSYQYAGWTAEDKSLLIYDRWDIWKVDPSGNVKPVSLTRGYGRQNLVRLRYLRLNPESRAIDLSKPLLLSGLDHRTKASGFVRLDPETQSLNRLIWLDENLSGLRKARHANDLIFTRSSFRRFPDLWSSKLGPDFDETKKTSDQAKKEQATKAGKDVVAEQKSIGKNANKSGFKSIHRLSNVNPHQSDYSWGTAELVNWKAKDGQKLDGILYKPDGFDPKKQYPLLVYFYERYSDRLHTHYPPAAGRSIINFSFYVSRGYVVFVPDIPYTVGEPGPSAANAILPGVEKLIAQGFVDPKRVGMQGHSWGGYQVAYLVTKTDMFACAESGAPVSNMTSAYGGIRWGSGMSRMFQYEKTQSRIGGTLWDSREKYIANSPVFFADRINTPLLILHNDKDTAVPWYQGIELFVALRRLERPAWMLNYNDDPHWVMGEANRLDFAKRMQQFFDHYLMGQPMPVWMAKGIPAVDKGKKFGFEPAENERKENE